MFVLSVAIIIAYIQPALSKIAVTQQEVATYDEIIEKAAELNAALNSLVQTEATFRNSDVNALEIFLPAVLDELQVMADIANIATLSGVNLSSLAAPGTEGNATRGEVVVDGQVVIDTVRTNTHDFQVEVSGQYENFKNFLVNLNQNKYVLDVSLLEFGGSETSDSESGALAAGTYSLTLQAHTYSYRAAVPDSGNDFNEFNDF